MVSAVIARYSSTDMIDRFQNRSVAAWKWLLSFAKSEWSFKDYPVAIRKHKHDPGEAPSRLKPVAVSAAIVNWWTLSGSGDTREAAVSDLKQNFSRELQARRSEGKRMPRPGSHVPLEFASTENVNAHSELANDFIRRVLELDWAFISDESSLWHFHNEDTNDRLISKIKEVYGADVSDLEAATLYEIFDRIKAQTDRVR
jgi:hypothetical protein